MLYYDDRVENLYFPFRDYPVSLRYALWRSRIVGGRILKNFYTANGSGASSMSASLLFCSPGLKGSGSAK